MEALIEAKAVGIEPYQCTGSLSDIINEEAATLIELSNAQFVEVTALSGLTPRTFTVTMRAGTVRVEQSSGLELRAI